MVTFYDLCEVCWGILGNFLIVAMTATGVELSWFKSFDKFKASTWTR